MLSFKHLVWFEFSKVANAKIIQKAQIPQLKEFFLADSQLTRTSNKIMKQTKDRVMMQRFGELMRKIWKNHHYRPHVSPHEFLQSVVLASKGRFQFTKRGNAGEFLTWFLNMLDKTHKKQTKEQELASSRPKDKKFSYYVRLYAP